MSARLPLTLEQVAELRQATEKRERAITDGLLQVPDYPPLPACPACGQHPDRIDSQAPPLGPDALLVDFEPCGHGFRASRLA